jgi:hypothetical protein
VFEEAGAAGGRPRYAEIGHVAARAERKSSRTTSRFAAKDFRAGCSLISRRFGSARQDGSGASRSDPGKLATIAYGLLPRDVFINVQQQTPGSLEPEAWATLRRALDLIEACKVEGDPQAVFADLLANRANDDERHASKDRNGDERTGH